MRPFVFCILSLFLILSCNTKQKPDLEENGAFMKNKNEKHIHLDRIINSGELIITTLYGPDSYFDYQGTKMGLQYALVENFAASLGIGIRVETASDTVEMIQKLKSGEVDLIAYQLPDSISHRYGLTCAGVHNRKSHTSWAIRSDETDFGEELNSWYRQDLDIVVKKVETRKLDARKQVRRKVCAPFISREKGIISIYDGYFKKAAMRLGWDWKLLAAQCYQESGFDPNAISYMGAQGLMQIMPATAQHLNLSSQQIFIPSENIEAASRYLHELQNKFSSIRNPQERIKFVLASYNGGPGHIKDAQALARKYGQDSQQWSEVSTYVLKLSEPRYYRDPVVQYGYMIGSETYHYVQEVLKRWQMYGGRALPADGNYKASTPKSPGTDEPNKRPASRKANRFSKEQKIYSLDELQQH